MTIAFEIDGRQYRAGRLSARQQFHVMRRLSPLVEAVAPAVRDAFKTLDVAKPDIKAAAALIDIPQIVGGLTHMLGTIPDAEFDYVIDTCLSVIERQQQGGGWARILDPRTKRVMFDDLDELAVQTRMVWEVLSGNLTTFFAALPRPSSDAAPAASTG